MANYDFNAIRRAFSGMKDPMSAIRSMAASNPNARGVMDMMSRGMNPKGIFESMCAQRGINPNDFIRAITGSNGNVR